MSSNFHVLAGITDWLPWYSWICMALLIVVVIIWRIQRNKMV